MSEEAKVTLEQVVDNLKGLLSMIETGLREGSFPEVSRSYVERLGRSIRDTLNVLEIVGKPYTIQSPLSASGRGAMYNLRKAFYATLSRLAKEEGVDRDRSVEEWRKAARRIIDFMNEEGITESPSKIVLSYEIAEEEGKKYVKPKSAQILFFELEGVKELPLE